MQGQLDARSMVIFPGKNTATVSRANAHFPSRWVEESINSVKAIIAQTESHTQNSDGSDQVITSNVEVCNQHATLHV